MVALETVAGKLVANDAGTPLVTVLIPSVNGLPSILECLQALADQDADISREIIVIDCVGEAVRSAIRARFPRVRLIAVEGRPSIPALRARGLAEARGAMIAVTEDHCLVGAGWLRAIARAHAAGHPAIGGAVENGSRARTVDWAVYFCEYAGFMAPVPSGPAAAIPGNNSAVDRRIFEELGPESRAERWESFLHARMRELGVSFRSDPEMVVMHKKEFGYFYFLAQRFHYSRSFAAMRLDGASWGKRIGYAVATIFLPPLLGLRITRSVLQKGRNLGWFARAAPCLATFLVSWAVGEAVGAIFGSGDSLERVE